MMQLHQDIDKFNEKKIKIVDICPEKESKVEAFIAKNKLNLDLVSDNSHNIANKYGQQVKLLKLGRMPAQIILDGKGEVVFKSFANSMKDIIENKDILSKF